MSLPLPPPPLPLSVCLSRQNASQPITFSRGKFFRPSFRFAVHTETGVARFVVEATCYYSNNRGKWQKEGIAPARNEGTIFSLIAENTIDQNSMFSWSSPPTTCSKMGEDETGVTDGRPSGLNERSAERMEWKERRRRNVVYTGMMHEGCLVVGSGGNGATNTHTYIYENVARRILFRCFALQREIRGEAEKEKPQEMSSFLLNIPRTTAQGNWLARGETNWIRSSSSSSIEFRIPLRTLCQTALFQSSVATLALRFNDTPFERSIFPFSSQKFSPPILFSTEFA